MPAATGQPDQNRPQQHLRDRRAHRQRLRRDQQVCLGAASITRGLLVESSRPIARSLPSPESTRSCDMVTSLVDSDYREQIWATIRRRAAHHRETLPCRCVVWCGKASTTWPDAAKSPPLLAARSHYVQPPGHAPREPSQTTICVACLLSRVLLVCARYASGCVARVWMRCVGRASKLECRVLCIVVIYHLYTRDSLGCDGAARGSRRRDRPFRH